MVKKIFSSIALILMIFGAGIAQAEQSGGVASGTGPSLPGGIQASISPKGLGDSLLFGYYNVRGNLNLFNVINTSRTDGAKARVVFRSAKTGESVLWFSVCLSRNDVWTAYLIDNGTTAALCRYDTDTITAPTIPTSCVPFKIPTGSALTNDDLREGYFEVIGLQSIPGYDKTTAPCPNGATCPIKSESDCALFNSGSDLANVLMGSNSIVELSTLATYSYNAVAVADARLSPMIDPGLGTDISIPSAMDKGCAEADYIFMKSEIVSPFNVIPAIGGETEIIVTFPTRLECHNSSSDKIFNPSLSSSIPWSGTYCTVIDFSPRDDKGQRQVIIDFGQPRPCLPFAVNLITGSGSKLFDSSVRSGFFGFSPFELGWLDIDLVLDPQRFNRFTTYGSNPSRTAYGLPAVAYTTQSFLEGSASYMTPVTFETRIE